MKFLTQFLFLLFLLNQIKGDKSIFDNPSELNYGRIINQYEEPELANKYDEMLQNPNRKIISIGLSNEGKINLTNNAIIGLKINNSKEFISKNPDFVNGEISSSPIKPVLTKSYEDMLKNPGKKIITLGINYSDLLNKDMNNYIIPQYETPVIRKTNKIERIVDKQKIHKVLEFLTNLTSAKKFDKNLNKILGKIENFAKNLKNAKNTLEKKGNKVEMIELNKTISEITQKIRIIKGLSCLQNGKIQNNSQKNKKISYGNIGKTIKNQIQNIINNIKTKNTEKNKNVTKSIQKGSNKINNQPNNIQNGKGKGKEIEQTNRKEKNVKKIQNKSNAKNKKIKVNVQINKKGKNEKIKQISTKVKNGKSKITEKINKKIVKIKNNVKNGKGIKTGEIDKNVKIVQKKQIKNNGKNGKKIVKKVVPIKKVDCSLKKNQNMKICKNKKKE